MILQRGPLILVLLGGIFFALARWNRHPNISLLTFVGLLLYLLKFFIFAGLAFSIPRIMESMHWSYAVANNLYLLLDVLNSLVFSGILILLVAVAFAQRGKAPLKNS
jgi:hypothetical protein